MASRERIVKLEEIEDHGDQTMIVKKGMELKTEKVYFTPDPDKPREGFMVEISPIIHAVYSCRACPRIVVATLFRPDVLNGNIAKTKQCVDCKGRMSLSSLEAERERPVVISGSKKKGLEDWIED